MSQCELSTAHNVNTNFCLVNIYKLARVSTVSLSFSLIHVFFALVTVMQIREKYTLRFDSRVMKIIPQRRRGASGSRPEQSKAEFFHPCLSSHAAFT